MALTRDEAIADLARMCAATSDPPLDAVELESLVALAGRVQADGSVLYVDLNAAAAEGWRRKAGKAAAGFTVKSSSGAQANQNEVFQQCMAMHAVYAEAAAADAQKYVVKDSSLWTASTSSSYGNDWNIEDLVGNL